MQSKKSFFSKTVFQKNFARFWPVYVGYFLFLIISGPMCILRNSQEYYQTTEEFQYYVINLLKVSSDSILIQMFAIIAAVCVFSYLFRTRSAYMMHALPVSRTCLFVTNYLSGLLFLLIPQVLNFIIMIPVMFASEYRELSVLLPWISVQILYSFIFYTFCVFCGMLTGQLLAMPVFTLIFNFVVVCVSVCMDSMFNQFVYGYTDFISEKLGFLSPGFYLEAYSGFGSASEQIAGEPVGAQIDGLGLIGLYVAAAVVCLVLAFIMYQKRHLEMTGELLVFRFLRPIFRWSASFCASAGLTVCLYYVFFYDYNSLSSFTVLTLMMAVTGIICFVISQMFVKKSFRVFEKRLFTEWFIYAVVVFGFMMTFECDLYGIEKKIPQVSEVSNVTINVIASSGNVTFDTEEGIAKAIELHQYIIDEKKRTEKELSYEDSYDDVSLDICYTLHDGSTLRRSYCYSVSAACLRDSESVACVVRQFYNEPAQTYAAFVNKMDVAGNVRYGSITLTEGKGEDVVYNYKDLTTEQAQTLIEAVIEDIENDRMEQFYYYTDSDDWDKTAYVNELSFTVKNKDGNNETLYATIRTTSTSTIQALIDLEIIESVEDLTLYASEKANGYMYQDEVIYE